MGNKQMKHMMNGAVILSVASLIAKILSAVYRVPFQNMVGNTGFYVYQQVYPLYGIGMTFALSGFPIFLSKLVAERKSQSSQKELLKRTFVILSIFSIVLFAGIYGFAGKIASLMGDSGLTPLVQAVSWMFLCMPFLVVWRGYFQGTYRMLPTAVSQVVEQVVRVAVILIAAFLYLKLGWTDYQMGTIAMSSAWIAGIAALLVLAYYYYVKKEANFIAPAFEKQGSEELYQPTSYSTLLYRFLTEGTAICILSAMLILLQLIDSFTLYKGMTLSGISPDVAKNLKGIYDRGQPLVQLGMVVGTGFAASLVPMLSNYYVSKREFEFQRTAVSLLRITTAFAMAATSGMLVLLPYINHVLFGDRAGNGVLSIYLLSIILASLIGAYNAILQSRNQHRLAMIALLVGLVVKVLFDDLLVRAFGTLGASLATVMSLAVILSCLWIGSPVALKGSILRGGFLVKLVLCCWVMTFVVLLTVLFLSLFPLFSGRSGAILVTFIGIIVGVSIFGFSILKWKLFTIREWLYMPFGKKLLRK